MATTPGQPDFDPVNILQGRCCANGGWIAGVAGGFAIGVPLISGRADQTGRFYRMQRADLRE